MAVKRAGMRSVRLIETARELAAEADSRAEACLLPECKR
jgi:hypothetical protein